MTEHEKKLFEKWIIDNVDARDVPGDEGNSEALVYNLVYLLRDGPHYRHYNYEPDQDAEIATWRAS